MIIGSGITIDAGIKMTEEAKAEAKVSRIEVSKSPDLFRPFEIVIYWDNGRVQASKLGKDPEAVIEGLMLLARTVSTDHRNNEI